MALTGREKGGVLLALTLIFVWHVWSGLARPGALTAPGGDPGLCLALLIWRRAAGDGPSLAVWGVGLLLGSVVSGVSPVWAFLAGWPAWLLVRALTSGRDFRAFLGFAALLLPLCRCAGKLLLLSVPGLGSPLTLTAPGLAGSLLADAVPNVFFLGLFSALLGKRPQ